MSPTPASLLTIFGASGDLAQRMLLPSLYGLHRERLLPPGLRILGSARSEYDDAGFRENVAQAKGKLIDTSRHRVLKAPHPSPLSAHRGFIGCGHFSAANEYLLRRGHAAIDWSLPPVERVRGMLDSRADARIADRPS